MKKSIAAVACVTALAAFPAAANAGPGVGGAVQECTGGSFGATISAGAQSGFKLGQHQVPGAGGGASAFVAVHCG